LPSSSPLHIAGKGIRFFFPFFSSSLSLSLSYLPKNPDTTHIPLMAYHRDEKIEGTSPVDGCTEIAQATLPLQHDRTGVG